MITETRGFIYRMTSTDTAPTVSVITVTYNNAPGLHSTLASLAALSVPPSEVIVIDACSSDDTPAVIERHRGQLPIRFVSEPDAGIYDAMNKGQRLARSQLLHYLNAGDVVWGEPYLSLDGPCLLPTRICSPEGGLVFEDFVKLDGYGYCHQGLLLPRDHERYNTQLRIAADLEMIIATFPQGLGALKRASSGGVQFFLGGVSSMRRRKRDREIYGIALRRLPLPQAARLAAAVFLKGLVPGGLRQRLARGLARSNADQNDAT
jgi:glycosyltransferase involved in cell wall biosynthesis